MSKYIQVNKSLVDQQISYIFSSENDDLGTVHNAGDKNHTCYFGRKNYEVDLEELEQIVNFMKIGPCPDCGGYVRPEQILIHCTKCNYILCSG